MDTEGNLGAGLMKSAPRILIVDDEQAVRRTLRQILIRAGYPSVVEAADGESALARLRREHFDIVITDVQLPVMSGLHLLVQVSREFPRIAIVIMTGFAALHPRQQVQALGPVEYLPKPLDPRAVEAVLAKFRPAASTAKTAPVL